MKVGVVYPDVHRELELTHQAGAADKGGDTSFDSVVGFVFGQGRPVGPSATNHLSALHVDGCVTGIHAPNVGSARTAVTVGIHFAVIEIGIAFHVLAPPRISLAGWGYDWCPPTP